MRISCGLIANVYLVTKQISTKCFTALQNRKYTDNHRIYFFFLSIQLSATLPHRKPLKRSPNRSHGVSPSSSAGASPVHSRRGSLTVNSSNSNTTVGLSVPAVPSPLPGPVDRSHNVESVTPVLVKQEPKHNG